MTRKKTRRGRANSRPKRLRAVPARDTFADMKGATISPLTIARLAADDAPSLREVARVMGVSPALLSGFELGYNELSVDRLKAYAEAIGRDAQDVRLRFVQAALAYHVDMAKQFRAELMKNRKRGLSPGKRLRSRV